VPLLEKITWSPTTQVMGDVSVCQEIPVAADAREPSGRGGAVHGHELAEGVSGSDLQMRRLRLVLQVLERWPMEQKG